MKILRVSAIWCPACIIMRPRYENIIKKYNIDSEELDFDMDEGQVLNLNVGNILPVAILYKDEIELTRIIGEKSENELESIIKEFI